MPSLKETSPESPAPVRAVANALAQYVDRLGTVWVEGQITQISRPQGINTVFMVLRDPVATLSIRLTCSRQLFESLNPPLVDGAAVVVHAKPSYYPTNGTLSLSASDIRPVGLGELLARIERRRQLLAAEGLFAAELKRPLPFLPGTIGLITGERSAAERDVLENAKRRWPAVRFQLAYAAMQGQRAAAEVIDALQRLDRDPNIDVIVIARGGGSVEDLLPFSDEALIRAVHQARTPVVSAIGHEPDSPLLDLVADYRASTPTDAARHVVPDMTEELARVRQGRDRLRAVIRAWLDREQAALDALRSRPSMADPRNLLDARAEEVEELVGRARRSLRHRLERADDEIGHHVARARALSPLATLRRGYAVLQDAHGHVVTSVESIDKGSVVAVRVVDGRVHAKTTGVEPLPTPPSEEEADG